MWWLGLMLAAWSATPDADALLRNGQLEEALELASDAARGQSDDLNAQELWIDLSATLRRSDDVVQVLVGRLSQDPENPDIHYLMGRALQDVTASREAYEVALKLDPDHARSWMGLGALHRATGNLPAAAEAYGRAHRLDATLSEAWVGHLTTRLQAGETRSVRDLAAAARQAVPAAVEPWLIGARLDGAQATALLEQALVTCGRDVRIFVALSEAMLRADQVAEGLTHARAALDMDPTSPAAQIASAYAEERSSGALDGEGLRVLLDLRGTDAKPSAFASTISRCPDSALARMARASAWGRQGNTRSAIEDLNEALRLQPDNVETRAVLGLALLESSPKRAAELLVPVAAARPQDAALAFSTGRALVASDQTSRATEHLRAAAERHPVDVRIQLLYAQVLGASDKREAFSYLERAAARVPDVRLVLGMAAAAHEAGETARAIQIYDALAERTGDPRFTRTADQLRASQR
ncbi:MAG: tetratricopeptide repeat protein [Myxococcota bacterium]